MLGALRNRKTESGHRSRGTSNTVDTTGLGFTGLIAAWSAQHHWLVIAGSIAVLVLAFVAAGAVGMKGAGLRRRGRFGHRGRHLGRQVRRKLPADRAAALQQPHTGRRRSRIPSSC